MKFNHYGTEYDGSLQFDRYAANGNLAVQIVTGDEPFATLCTNVEGVVLLDDEFVAKTYSENEGLCEQFIEAGCFERTGKVATVGFAGEQPILRVLPEHAEISATGKWLIQVGTSGKRKPPKGVKLPLDSTPTEG